MHPELAALSIVLTALSTAAGVVMTPFLVLLLLGKHLPVDVQGMAISIMQIVVAPVGLGQSYPVWSSVECCQFLLLTCAARVSIIRHSEQLLPTPDARQEHQA